MERYIKGVNQSLLDSGATHLVTQPAITDPLIQSKYWGCATEKETRVIWSLCSIVVHSIHLVGTSA